MSPITSRSMRRTHIRTTTVITGRFFPSGITPSVRHATALGTVRIVIASLGASAIVMSAQRCSCTRNRMRLADVEQESSPRGVEAVSRSKINRLGSLCASVLASPLCLELHGPSPTVAQSRPTRSRRIGPISQISAAWSRKEAWNRPPRSAKGRAFSKNGGRDRIRLSVHADLVGATPSG